MDEKADKFNMIHEFYKKCQDLEFTDTDDLMLQTNDNEERDFIRVVTDFVLQQKQRQVIAEKRF